MSLPNSSASVEGASLPDPIEFSRAMDACFLGIADRIEPNRRHRLLAQHSIAPELLARLKQAVRNYVDACADVPPLSDETAWFDRFCARLPDLPNVTPNGMICPKREHILEFNHLQRALAAALALLPAWDGIETVAVPLSLRVIQGVRDPSFGKRAYDTAKWHTDVWVGEPLDAFVVHIPLFGDVENVGVEFAELPAEMEQALMKAFPSFDDAGGAFLSHLRPYPQCLEIGRAAFADSRLIHRTLRRTPGVRLSIDLRLRTRSTGLVRELSNELMTSFRQGNYVSVDEWRNCGSSWLIVPDETMAEARKPRDPHAVARKHPVAFKPVRLFE